MKTEIFTFNTTNYTILIGQNAQENTEIVTNAFQHDIWFHRIGHPRFSLTCVKLAGHGPWLSIRAHSYQNSFL